MSDYARTGADEQFGTEHGADDPQVCVRDRGEKRSELQRLLLSRATIRINAALLDDRSLLEHESALEH